ncbi:glycoside hydrolase family 31 protein [Leadbettera azotonutricia]|uniref:Glycoside hydrolase, family 31 n=1 Tax=Leadbettera azotonutricia (strain ATCC BAA-888 / DSM 13862 / ZAS-9) TaxID=545695 RepID=F5YFA8_LEAAZ|nr:glycoside hydrolase family 31 protein [Leadbettera azotonutricia]AEF81222.1 glycoside hydrolase, family 31 [Leadbettera azotonutricia ZAS-9]
MASLFSKEGNRLIYRYDAEKVWIEAWGENSLRVRASKMAEMPTSDMDDWALLPPKASKSEIRLGDEEAVIHNGKIELRISRAGKIVVFNQKGEKLLEEFIRNRRDVKSEYCSALDIENREFKPIIGGDYELTLRLEEVSTEERIYGMGQYQQPWLNLKGCTLELAHRNSQASVPFMVSSLGYGFLWNNPAVGRVTFGKNMTVWEARSTKKLDYWITAGDNPAEIEEAYAQAAGTVPEMPDYALGFWQCKLRYQTQEELLSVAREYKKRNLPISVIVIDFFHWPLQGEWKFDPVYWPDPDAMIAELKKMNIELMVSIWPTVDRRSENWEEMLEKGYLIRTERGYRIGMDFQGNTIHYDATNPEAREYVWNKVKKNYYEKGIRVFWLDEAEPEYAVYDFEQYRYHLGPNLQIGNIYPVMYAKTFFDGMEKAGQKNIINLLRCAWAGSQRYGALVWSGDIHSSFASLRNQLAAGLNMGMAGIPWWTTDIGGFHGGEIADPRFHELLIRWFQWGCFCPVMRLHGNREPIKAQYGTTGGATCLSGADNEVWSYSDEVYGICKKYLSLREKLKPYIAALMKAAHKKGTPVMRPLFYDFSGDKNAWEIEDEYMFGPNYLVAPILYEGLRDRKLYLPFGTKWTNAWTGEIFEGGKEISVTAPLDQIPIFTKDGSRLE